MTSGEEYLEPTDDPLVYEHVFEENDSFVIEFEDLAENTGSNSPLTVAVDWIDKVNPTATVSYTPASLTNTNVTATITFSEPVIITSGEEYLEPTDDPLVFTAAFEENDSFVIEYEDLAGNPGENPPLTVEVDWIDKTPPEVTVEGNPEDWTNQDATLIITASDSESGLDAQPYSFSFDDEETWKSENEATYAYNETVIVKVRDNAGNVTVVTVVIVKIDKEAPVIYSVTGNPEEWTKDDVTLTVTASDLGGAGLHPEAYSFNGGADWQSANYNLDPFTDNQTVEIWVRDNVIDNPQNITKISVPITKIDKLPPVITSIGKTYPEDEEGVTLTVIANDEGGSGLHDEAYSFDGGDNWQTSNIKKITQSETVIVMVRDRAENPSAKVTLYSITDVVNPPKKDVEYRYTAEALQEWLEGEYPTRAVNLSDEGNDDFLVTWNVSSSGYDGEVSGKYTICGELNFVSRNDIINPLRIAAEIEVEVGPEPPPPFTPIISVEPLDDIIVPVGTTWEALCLPEKVTANYDGGSVQIGVDWDEGVYDSGSVGEITVTGELIELDGYANPIPVFAQIKIVILIPTDTFSIGGYQTDPYSIKAYMLEYPVGSDEYAVFVEGNGQGQKNILNFSNAAPAGWDTFKAKITRVIVGKNIPMLGVAMFRYCPKLYEVRLPEGLNTLEAQAFYSCAALERIVLPSTLNVIPDRAFAGCNKLTLIKFLNEGEISMAANAFLIENSTFYNLDTAVICNNSYIADSNRWIAYRRTPHFFSLN